MTIPMVNLAALIEVSRADCEARLAEMFARAQFILGPQVAAFEQEFAAAMGARFALGVGTGTAAIELCFRALGITSRKQEVIVPALTSLFSAQAVLAAGATPRFADVDDSTLLLDIGAAEEAIGKNTAAILPVHLYGQPCDMRAFSRLGVPLVQDACQAHGLEGLAKYSPVAYSFYPTKNLPAIGDGGAVATGSAAVAGRVRLLRDGGRRGGQVSRMPAINSRLDEMQACYLRAFLPRLQSWNADRARLAARYDAALAGCPGVRLLNRVAGSVNHLYVIRAAKRERLRGHLAKRGIQTAIHYPVPLHAQPAFREFAGSRRFPNAERACRRILSLPLWPLMPEEFADRVAGEIRAFYIS